MIRILKSLQGLRRETGRDRKLMNGSRYRRDYVIKSLSRKVKQGNSSRTYFKNIVIIQKIKRTKMDGII